MTDIRLYLTLLELSDENKKAVLEFIESLPKEPQVPKKRVAGLAKGMIEIKEGFDDPIDFSRL
jgi:hypothetical protein